jgi:DNA-binding NarL/FixJ family response regulator
MNEVAQIPAPMLDVLLVENHDSTRQEMTHLLEAEPDISVVAQSPTAEDGLKKASQLHPSVVVMDLGLPGMNGLAATRYLLAEDPASRVLVLSNHVGADLVKLALAAGAKGFVRKDHAFEELVPAIRALGREQHYWGKGVDED